MANGSENLTPEEILQRAKERQELFFEKRREKKLMREMWRKRTGIDKMIVGSFYVEFTLLRFPEFYSENYGRKDDLDAPFY